MKKSLFLSFIIIATSLISQNSMAEVRPYIGIGYNSFVITSSDMSATSTTTGATTTSSENSTDGGTSIGLNGGVAIDDSTRVNFAYFSGKESNTSILKATVTALSYDYCFNNSGVQKGWFLGAGVSSVKTEIEDNSLTTSSSKSSSSLALRGGYQYLMDNNLFFEVGYNAHLAKQKHEYDYKNYSNIEGSTNFSVNNLNLSLSYMFQ
jgi:outer membrane protein W